MIVLSAPTSYTVIADPSPARSFGREFRSIIERFLSCSWSWVMRDFTKCWRSSADWYSAFSRRSPICSARWISLGRSWRYSFSRAFSSFSSLSLARASMNRDSDVRPRNLPSLSGVVKNGRRRRGGWGAFRPPRLGVGCEGGLGLQADGLYIRSRNCISSLYRKHIYRHLPLM